MRSAQGELHRLKTVERPAVIPAIAEARSHGDLSENADYEAAKERQGFIEGRIASREQARERPDHRPVADRCRRPRRVRRDVELEDRRAGCARYQIVGDDEADIKHGKISVSSPIARALIGKARATRRRCRRPGGTREYEV